MPTERPTKKHKGLVIINTGEGKGKSTAGFGMLLRGWGRDMKVAAVQFIKGETSKFGEHMALAKMGVEVIPAGRGFTWTSHDLDVDAEKARHGWKTASEMILSGEYDVMMLDEITYPINWGWIDAEEVRTAIESRPEATSLVLTGRDAPEWLMDISDTVTVMGNHKHAYESGIAAKKGIDY